MGASKEIRIGLVLHPSRDDTADALISLGGDGTMLGAPMVVSASEAIRFELLPESGRAAIEVDGLKLCEVAAGDALDVVLSPAAGQVVRLDRDRFQRRNQVKLSLLDLPLEPEELRELAPGP